jgi:hypothetical protein
MTRHHHPVGPGRRRLIGALLGAAALLLAPAWAGAQGADAQLRVAHLSPDAPAVDVYVGGNRVVTNATSGSVSPYLRLPGGSAAVKVTRAGAGAGAPGLLELAVPIAGGRAYTLATAGRLAELQGLVLTDDVATPAAGKAKLRLVHGSPNAPAVDVAVAGGPVLFRDVSFREASDYVEVDAGAYNLEVRPAGQTVVALPVPGVRVQPGVTYTVFGYGLLQGQPPFQALAVADAAAGTTMPGSGGGGMAADQPWLAGPAAMAAGALALIALARAVRRRMHDA